MKQAREPMYSINELSKLYKVSLSTIDRWTKKEGCPQPVLLKKCQRKTQYYPLEQFKQFVGTIKRYEKC